jgi:hypothetical protein
MFWRLRVWLWSAFVRVETDVLWTMYFTDINGSRASIACNWDDVERHAASLELTPPGEPAFVRAGYGSFLAKPECVPTMARMAREAADAYARSTK